MTTTTPPGIGDLYRLLGVGPQASPVAIKQAYRRLARQLHPDVNPDPSAREGFVAVTSAYEVLSNPGRRAAYDRCRTAAPAPPSPPPPPGSGAAGRWRPAGPAAAADYVPADDDPGGCDARGHRRWSDYEPRPDPPQPTAPAPDPWGPSPPRPAPPRWMAGSRQRWPRGWPGGRIEQHRWLCPFTLALWRIAPLPCNGLGKLLVILGWVYGGWWAGEAVLALVPATALDSATVSAAVLWWLPVVVWSLRGLISGCFTIAAAGRRARRAVRQTWARGVARRRAGAAQRRAGKGAR